ncbi:MAG: YggT family protein [Aquificaceae bacterium]|jgi:YggT family protein|uniref:YggT family protein n=1 Tax=Hydrogenobacter sp. Uz 6-8 TaxID=3384828 RepID=UPI000F15361F|nr:MAG: YggT family protein [Aquificota bacterium]
MIKGILSFLINLLIILVLLHAVGSWIPKIRESKFYERLDSLIAPLLSPIRKIVPPAGGLDFSPLILLFILYLIKYLLKL